MRFGSRRVPRVELPTTLLDPASPFVPGNGDADPYLNSGVARTFHEYLPDSELFLIPGAQHFVQLDEPEQVARLILAMPGPGNTPAQ